MKVGGMGSANFGPKPNNLFAHPPPWGLDHVRGARPRLIPGAQTHTRRACDAVAAVPTAGGAASDRWGRGAALGRELHSALSHVGALDEAFARLCRAGVPHRLSCHSQRIQEGFERHWTDRVVGDLLVLDPLVEFASAWHQPDNPMARDLATRRGACTCNRSILKRHVLRLVVFLTVLLD